MRIDNPSDDFDAMLLDDARRDTPAFSPSLHNRVMQRVSAVHVARRATVRLSSPGWTSRIAIAAAAGVAIAVTGWLFNRSTPPPAQIARVTLPSPSTFEPLVAETIAVGDAAHDARFGYLDQDLKSFATFVRDTVPSAPLPRRG